MQHAHEQEGGASTATYELCNPCICTSSLNPQSTILRLALLVRTVELYVKLTFIHRPLYYHCRSLTRLLVRLLPSFTGLSSSLPPCFGDRPTEQEKNCSIPTTALGKQPTKRRQTFCMWLARYLVSSFTRAAVSSLQCHPSRL